MIENLKAFLGRDPKTTVGGIVSICTGVGLTYRAITEWNMEQLTVGLTAIVTGAALLFASDSKPQVPAYQLRATDKLEVDRKPE